MTERECLTDGAVTEACLDLGIAAIDQGAFLFIDGDAGDILGHPGPLELALRCSSVVT